jgi:hypothetical protein
VRNQRAQDQRGVISKSPTIKAVKAKIEAEEENFDFSILDKVVEDSASIFAFTAFMVGLFEITPQYSGMVRAKSSVPISRCRHW